MLIVIANIIVKENRVQEFIENAQDCIQKTRMEEGNISYNLLCDSEEECKLTFVEYWTDKESLDKHMKSEHFKNLGSAIMELLAKPLDINVYDANKI